MFSSSKIKLCLQNLVLEMRALEPMIHKRCIDVVYHYYGYLATTSGLAKTTRRERRQSGVICPFKDVATPFSRPL